MRILVLTHRFPYPPNKGDRIRSFHILKYLAAQAQVDLATLAHEPASTADQQALGQYCDELAIFPVSPIRKWLNALTSLLRGKSLTEGLFKSQELKSKIADWAANKQYDAVVAFCSSMQQYLELPELSGVAQVVDLIDVDSKKWQAYANTSSFPKQQIFRLEASRVETLERRILKNSRAVLVVSDDELRLLAPREHHRKCIALPNGVNTEYFQPAAAEPDSAGQPTCVFVGAMDYLPNVEGVTWFCNHVWPEIKNRFPQAKFQIVGRRPTPSILALQSIPGVEIFADVPDVRPYLRGANAVVAPLQIARGIQNKVLEAMAMGKAVIASPGAMTGIHVEQDQHLLVAQTSTQWQDTLGNVLASTELQQQLGLAARKFVEDFHDWETCLGPLADILALEENSAQEFAHA